eukprot:gene7030-1257_t
MATGIFVTTIQWTHNTTLTLNLTPSSLQVYAHGTPSSNTHPEDPTLAVPSQFDVRTTIPKSQADGMSHKLYSLRCALKEAVMLNRTLVVPSTLMVSKEHNHGKEIQMSTEDLVTTAHPYASLITSRDYEARGPPTGTTFSSDMALSSDYLRSIDSTTTYCFPGRYGYQVCWYLMPQDEWQRPMPGLRFSPKILHAAAFIVASLGGNGNYAAPIASWISANICTKLVLFPVCSHDSTIKPQAVLKSIDAVLPSSAIIWLMTNDPKISEWIQVLTAAGYQVHTSNDQAYKGIMAIAQGNNWILFALEQVVLRAAGSIFYTFHEDVEEAKVRAAEEADTDLKDYHWLTNDDKHGTDVTK